MPLIYQYPSVLYLEQIGSHQLTAILFKAISTNQMHSSLQLCNNTYYNSRSRVSTLFVAWSTKWFVFYVICISQFQSVLKKQCSLWHIIYWTTFLLMHTVDWMSSHFFRHSASVLLVLETALTLQYIYNYKHSLLIMHGIHLCLFVYAVWLGMIIRFNQNNYLFTFSQKLKVVCDSMSSFLAIMCMFILKKFIDYLKSFSVWQTVKLCITIHITIQI